MPLQQLRNYSNQNLNANDLLLFSSMINCDPVLLSPKDVEHG